MTLTPWFPDTTTPTRKGFYDTRVAVNSYVRARNPLGGTMLKRVSRIYIRLYWDGRAWLASPNSQRYTAGLFRQHREWRGVYR